MNLFLCKIGTNLIVVQDILSQDCLINIKKKKNLKESKPVIEVTIRFFRERDDVFKDFL